MTNILALGAEMNNIACLSIGGKLVFTKNNGDTSKYENFKALQESINIILKENKARPDIIACDMHPQYNTAQLSRDLAKKYKAKLMPIQHHKAHVASVAYEHKLKEYIGISMDGLGYGDDEKIWGGEVFLVKGTEFTRVGHLEEQPQLGGDSATLYPKKMLFGILYCFLKEKDLINLRLFDEKETRLYIKQMHANFNIEWTTSSGRILDAASAMLGVCEKRTYDGEPAIALEKFAGEATPYDLHPVLENVDGQIVLRTTPLFRFVVKNLKKDKRKLAATVQMYISKGLYDMAAITAQKEMEKNNPKMAEQHPTQLPIVFSGGVAYNKMISRSMLKNGVLLNKEIPCGDGGISAGQAYIASKILPPKS